ncbi:FAD-dependent oxidoreductase [Streptomyces sp. NPDC001380]|uniref:FAD-dependent oxidoreductase n=1 Tax=Streptomyces sp. NPDC001380 TaxID=3364566 RepID=UPI0036BEA2F8
MTNRQDGRPSRTLTADVAVVGGGLGGVAAALAAARAGRTVVLTCDQPVLGGQVTSQLVPALDEHPHVEQGGVSASYREFRTLVRSRYGGLANPGGGWVSRLCFEPAAAEQALADLLAPHVAAGRLRVLTGVRPYAARRDGDRLAEVHLAEAPPPATAPDRPGPQDGPAGADGRLALAADVFCDATETGELLPLAGAPWTVGSEGRDAHGEGLALPGGPQPHAVQSCTVGFAVEHRPGEDHTVPRPAGYRRWRDSQPFTLEIAGWDDRLHRYRMFADGPDGHPPFWTYRRLRDGALLGGRDIALVNWAGNDYADASLVHEPRRARAEARALSLAFLHWLQTECPRDDGSGRGYSGLRLAPAAAGTPDGLAAEPYVRESRRLLTDRPVREQDLLPVPGQARAAHRHDGAGVAWYHLDLHARVGHPQSAYAPTAPFQVPLSVLVADTPANLLAAAKNLAATQVAAAAYRVHHGEWAVGEAAGALAAHAAGRGTGPARVVADPRERALLQRTLARDGVPLAWLLDVASDDPLFPSAHLLAAAGGLAGPRTGTLDALPDEPATGADLRALAAAAERLAPGAAASAGPAAPGSTWRDVTAALGTAVDRALDRSARS